MKTQPIRSELQDYLTKVYPGSEIDITYSIFGSVHIRFELGGEQKSSPEERVRQATERATTLFEETFTNKEADIWLLPEEDSLLVCKSYYKHK